MKRWHWVVIALILGFTMGKVRQMYTDDIIADFGNTMNSPRQFELGLLAAEKGKPFFKDLIVYPDPAPRNKIRNYYIVAGKYYGGRPEVHSDGNAYAVWRPYCIREQDYVTKDGVYVPTLDLRTLSRPGGPDYVAKFKALPKPTILDFLKIMREARGVNFKYAWWAESQNAILLWMGGSLLLVGIIWPSIIYLLAFGSLTQPPQEDDIDLSQLKSVSTAPTAPVAPTGPSQKDLDQLQQMEQKLMNDLASRSDAGAGAARGGGGGGGGG
ncbi:MAG: hypothetical protein ACM359_23170, partial [Bacillota bacterium]